MARTATRPGPPSITLGVWGQGETDAENIAALLTDFVDGLDGEHTVKVLIPLDKDLTTDTISSVADVVAEFEGWELLVIQTAPPRVKALREIKDAATKTYESSPEKIEAEFTAVLAEARDARLLFLWADDADGEPLEDDQRLLFAAMDAGVQALDLTSGLDVLDSAPEEGEDTPAQDEAPEETPDVPDEQAVADDDGPSEEEIRGWAERRVRSYAIDCGMAKEEAADLKKAALLAWIFEEDETAAVEPDPEPEPEVDPEKPRSGRTIRKEIEAEGGSVPKTSRTRAKAAAAPQEPEDPADEGQTQVEGTGPLSEVEVSAAEAFGNLVADVIIERLAKRLEAEPEKSPLREEIAPTRPPGRPRGDGGAPTRRRTAK